MTKRDNTHQNSKVTLLQGGQILTIDSDGYFDFYGESVTGTMLKAMLYNGCRVSAIAQGATSTQFSQTNIPNSAKYVTFSFTSTCTNASAWLCSGPIIGQEMYILVKRGSCASGSVWISTSGVTLYGLYGSAISGFSLRNSTNSTARVHLVSMIDDSWSVVEYDEGYAE